MLDAEGQQLRARLFELFGQPVDEPLDDAAFNDLALAMFRYQFDRNRPLAAFCARRRRTPETVEHWTRIPPVPTAAFREIALVAGDTAAAEAIFVTSGTSSGGRGGGGRGVHYILDLSVYHGSLLAHFRARVLPDGATPIMLALVPPAADVPDSSLVHMLQLVVDELGGPGSRHVASAANGLDTASLEAALRDAESNGEAVCLLGTSFSFVHWIDHLRATGEPFRLPAGSRLMDTGGYKGRSREVPEAELRDAWQEWLGLEPDLCVNEYGMTELCSQFYDGALEERMVHGTSGRRRKVGPPWVRTRVVDADTLEPVANGMTGLLQHIDLANLGSVIAVQTEDLGHSIDDGFVVLGRAPGTRPRGCSIAMDDMLGRRS